MPEYDFLIAGGGVSGLVLAYNLASSSLQGQRILIVERDSKDQNDRPLCFWTKEPTRFDHLAYRTWEQVEVAASGYQQRLDIRPYRYRMIRALDFFRYMRESLEAVPGVEFLRARVQQITDTKDRYAAQAWIDDVPYGARWAFDSAFQLAEFEQGPRGYHYLKQYFKGWEIETPRDSFDARTVTLFDFRTPQKGSLRFFTILPFSKRRALIEYTILSAETVRSSTYDSAIADYLEKVRGIAHYRVDATESGMIPITDRPMPRKLDRRVMAIGTKGGLVKPTTTRAFLRFQRDAASITRSLENYGHPFQVPTPPRRYRLFDSLLLQMIYRRGDGMTDILTGIFRDHPIDDIFRFLDEQTSLSEDLRFFHSFPRTLFLSSLFRVQWMRLWKRSM